MGRAGWLALAGAWLLARRVHLALSRARFLRFEVARLDDPGVGVGRRALAGIEEVRPAAREDIEAARRLALDRADAEGHPLRWVLQAMRLGIAAAVDVLEPLWLDPH